MALTNEADTNTVDTEQIINNDVIDIDLSPIRKKRFRIDRDNNKILELNTSDMNVIVRLRDTYPKLQELVRQISEEKRETDDGFEFADDIENADMKLKEYMDYIFDAPVSQVCVGNGTMYDLHNGKFKFEHIIDTLLPLYEANLTEEFNSVKNRINKHTSKYTKSRKK